MCTHCTSFTTALAKFLTPQVWKQAHHCHQPGKTASRWDLHPVLLVLLLMTWSEGNSEAERFAKARAFYIACHQHSKRPGKSLSGFHQALAKLPLPVIHALLAAVRPCLQAVVGRYWRSNGFVVMAMDGSRLECPRSAALEKELDRCGKNDSAPMLMVGALVVLPIGLLWSWVVGPGVANEHDLLRQLLVTLPCNTLLVADAFYQGYDLYADILQANTSFLVRLSSKSHLYIDKQQPLPRFREGLVWYWPTKAQEQGKPPLSLRLIRVHARKKQDVWLLTNVLDPLQLSGRQAAELYRWRWQVEGVFRTYKRTLPKVKLSSRTTALLYREAEVSLLGLQLLLAQTTSAKRVDGVRVIVMGSPRAQLLKIRGEMITTIGAALGSLQQRWYRQRLAQVHSGGVGRKVRRKWPRRKDHKPPKPPKIRVLPKRLRARIHRAFATKRVA